MPDASAWPNAPEAPWQKLIKTEAPWQKAIQRDPFTAWLSREEKQSGQALGVRKTSDGREQVVALSDEERVRHRWCVGATGTGKTTLNVNMAVQDIRQGKGCTSIDPLGPSVAQTLPHIPKDRIEDVIYFNPADHERPISLNPFSAETEAEREWIAEALVIIFKRLFRVDDAPRLLHILRYAIRSLLETEHASFLDIRTILINPRFRAQVLQDVRNPYLLEFWEEEFPTYPKNAIDPITNKISQFRMSSVFRNTLGQSDTSLDFTDILRTRKILLADLAQGKIGQETSMILGSIIVFLFQLAAMREAPTSLYSIYIDEFPDVVSPDTSAFVKLLSQARNSRLGLTLSNQTLAQIPKELRSAILGNVHTMIAFRLGIEDARLLQAAFADATGDKTAPKFIQRLQNLSRGEALVRLGTASNNFLMRTYPPAPIPTPNYARDVIEYSRTRYGRPVTHTAYSYSSRPAGSAPPEAPTEAPGFPPGKLANTRFPPGKPENPVLEPEPPHIDPWQ